jgi:trimethylamine--corrinoid protein Co-methyltransferase
MERFGTLMPAVLAGVHFITCGGTLESTMTESHPLMVLDDEMCGLALRLARGIEVNEDTIALDLIKEVGWAGHYLDQMHTAEHYRQEFSFPRLLKRTPRDSWEKKGAKTAFDLARERVQELLAKYEPPELDPAAERELLDYLEVVRGRSMSDFEAREWEE